MKVIEMRKKTRNREQLLFEYLDSLAQEDKDELVTTMVVLVVSEEDGTIGLSVAGGEIASYELIGLLEDLKMRILLGQGEYE